MPKRVDLSGQRFHRLSVIRKKGNDKRNNVLWECQCECGKLVEVTTARLTSGSTKSCGCHRGNAVRTHGGSDWPEYQVWHAMVRRCKDPRVAGYVNYGGRGIDVCDRWLSFANFIADMGRRPTDRHSIEREDNDGDYCPQNCLWATRKTQNNNTRRNRLIEYRGEKKSMAEWARLSGIPNATLRVRLESGWEVGAALTTPVAAHAPRRQLTLTYRGETKPLGEWCKEMGVPYRTAVSRYNANLPPEDVLFVGTLEPTGSQQ